MKKIIFMGTPIFAAKILEEIIERGYDVALVVSQPDRKVGRKQKLVATPVKEVALKYNINIFQPERISDDYQEILDIEPDLIITAAYGQIIPDIVLECVKMDAINVHGSLLPKYRGGAPIHYSVINGDLKTGVTIMKMVSKMDAGDIIFQKSFPIGENDTTEIVHDNMIICAKELLLSNLDDILEGNYSYKKQDESKVTYSPNISKDDEKIDWNQKSAVIHNKIRGLNSWPGAYTLLDGERIKIYKSLKTSNKSQAKAGTIVNFDEESIVVSTLDFDIRLIEIQPAGKKKMLVKDFVLGIKKEEYNGKTFEN